MRTCFFKLKRAKLIPFPRDGWPEAPDKQGVYVIYAPRSPKVVHVGRTTVVPQFESLSFVADAGAPQRD